MIPVGAGWFSRRGLLAALIASGASAWTTRGQDPTKPPASLAEPIAHGPFLVPASGVAARPYWGIRGGIAIGLWPLRGPRGLFRIYAPYLGQPPGRVINFVAVEPVVAGRRGLSELELSRRDRMPGKAMSAASTVVEAARLTDPWLPAPARIERVEGGEELHLAVGVEPFNHSARVIVEVILHSARPNEVEFRVHAAPGSAAMSSCILTATMGNFARLRRLHLEDRIVTPSDLWPPQFPADAWGFLPHQTFPAKQLRQAAGHAFLATTSDEPDPASVADLPPGWRYLGRTATQTWKAPIQPGLLARVNARRTYWMSQVPIPGGPSFENVELEAPFNSGQSWTFGVYPEAPEALGFRPPEPQP